VREVTTGPSRRGSHDGALGDRESDLVLGAAAVLVLAQLGLTAWALFTNWFYYDDFSLLMDAQDSRFTLGYLLDPWNVHLMPFGRALAWVVASTGPLNWGLAASAMLVIQLLASLAAVWMLVTLFGRRLGILVPLTLYLSTAMTVPALMWWTASLNQLTMQLGFFVAVAAAVRYYRGDGLRWAFAAYGGVAIGLVSDVKAVLILPVVAFLAVAYFARGGPVRRVVSTVRGYWPAILIGAVAGGGYAAYYATHATEQTEWPSASDAVEAVGNMVGRAFGAAVVGGPWAWTHKAGVAAPPEWAVTLAWILIVLVVCYGALLRRRTGRAWALLVGYLAVLAALLVANRVATFGSGIGLEYRYLTDAACVVALTVGLVFMPVRGAVESSEPRDPPLLTRAVPTVVVVVVTALVAVSGTVSTARYVTWWRGHNDGDAFMHTLQAEMTSHGMVDVADTAVPERVMSGLLDPDNRVSRLSSLLDGELNFPDWSPALGIVDDDGTLHQVDIDGGTAARPGPVPGCGWKVDEDGTTIPLTNRTIDWVWWLKISYLSSADSPVTVSGGGDSIDAEVMTGLNDLYVKIAGPLASVRIDGLDPGVTMCVDGIEVGDPVPGGELS
jgi:hypothetical protein